VVADGIKREYFGWRTPGGKHRDDLLWRLINNVYFSDSLPKSSAYHKS